MKDPGAQSLAKYGTAGVTEIINEGYGLPSYNFRTGHRTATAWAVRPSSTRATSRPGRPATAAG